MFLLETPPNWQDITTAYDMANGITTRLYRRVDIVGLTPTQIEATQHALSQDIYAKLVASVPAHNEVRTVAQRTSTSLVLEAIVYVTFHDTQSTYVLPFGEHKGKRLCDVPLQYLCWLASECQHEEARAKARQWVACHPDIAAQLSDDIVYGIETTPTQIKTQHNTDLSEL